MVSYYSSVTPVIRNHPIYMQYSTHKELKTDNSPNQVVSVCNLTHTWGLEFMPKLLFLQDTMSYGVVNLTFFPCKKSWITDLIYYCKPFSSHAKSYTPLLSFLACPGSSAGSQRSARRWDGGHGHSSRCGQHGGSRVPKPCAPSHSGEPLLPRHPGCTAPGTD